MNKKILASLCALALTFSVITAASANDDDAGYNSSDSDSVTMGTDSTSGGEGPDDAAQMQDIQGQTDSLKERWGGDAQRQAIENGQ